MWRTAGFDGENGPMWRVYVDNFVQYTDDMLSGYQIPLGLATASCAVLQTSRPNT